MYINTLYVHVQIYIFLLIENKYFELYILITIFSFSTSPNYFPSPFTYGSTKLEVIIHTQRAIFFLALGYHTQDNLFKFHLFTCEFQEFIFFLLMTN